MVIGDVIEGTDSTGGTTDPVTDRLAPSVMHSDKNSFDGDVVLDSVNMASRDENSILDKLYEKQIFPNNNYEDLNFESD